VPIAITSPAPTKIPTAVPARALSTDQPVLKALRRDETCRSSLECFEHRLVGAQRPGRDGGGIFVGAGLVIAIGTHESVLWLFFPSRSCLPHTRLERSPSPRARRVSPSFSSCSQHHPAVGWTVGLVRIEDVAIASRSVSVWACSSGHAARRRCCGRTWPPRTDRSADYLVRRSADHRRGRPGSVVESRARRSRRSSSARRRVRQYLAERSANRMNRRVSGPSSQARHVCGARQSLSALGRMTSGDAGLTQCGENLDGEIHALRSCTSPSAIPSSIPPLFRRRTFAITKPQAPTRLRASAVAGGDKTKVRSALVLLWASQHLDNLWRLESHLGRSAAEASSD